MKEKLNGILNHAKTLGVMGIGAGLGLGLDHFGTFGNFSDYYGATAVGAGLGYAVKKRVDSANELESKAYQKLQESTLYLNENAKKEINKLNNLGLNPKDDLKELARNNS